MMYAKAVKVAVNPFSIAAKMYLKGLISWGEYRERVKWTKKKRKSWKECV